MVGAGKVDGGSSRWGNQFIDPVVSVYKGDYDPQADYDTKEPTKTLKLDAFGGVRPTPYPGGGVQVTRGSLQVKETGMYNEFRPGYGGSTYNLMEVDGKVVHRQEVGEDAVQYPEIKLEGGEEGTLQNHLLHQAGQRLGLDRPPRRAGCLSSTLVKFKGMYPYLIDENRQWKARQDVWYRGVVTAAGNRPLGVAGGRIGPEIGFGHAAGNHPGRAGSHPQELAGQSFALLGLSHPRKQAF